MSEIEDKKVLEVGYRLLNKKESISSLAKEFHVRERKILQWLKKYPGVIRDKSGTKIMILIIFLISIPVFCICFYFLYSYAEFNCLLSVWVGISMTMGVLMLLTGIGFCFNLIFIPVFSVKYKLEDKVYMRLKDKVNFKIKADRIDSGTKGAISITKPMDLPGGGLSMGDDKNGGLSKIKDEKN